jgi:hypothetical protein
MEQRNHCSRSSQDFVPMSAQTAGSRVMTLHVLQVNIMLSGWICSTSPLKMEAARSSKTLTHTYQTTHCHGAEEHNLNHCLLFWLTSIYEMKLRERTGLQKTIQSLSRCVQAIVILRHDFKSSSNKMLITKWISVNKQEILSLVLVTFDCLFLNDFPTQAVNMIDHTALHWQWHKWRRPNVR